MITKGHKTVFDFIDNPGKFAHFADKELYYMILDDNHASYDLYWFFHCIGDKKQEEYWSKQDKVLEMIENDKNFVFEA